MKNIALTFYPRCFIIARRTYKTFYFDKYFMSINNEITTRGFKFCKGRPFHLKGYQLQSHLWHSESLLLSISRCNLSKSRSGLVWPQGKEGAPAAPGMKAAREAGGSPKLLRAPGSRDWGIPKGRGIKGAEANLNLSSSDSWSRLVFARRFWNQILTWVSVSLSWAENSALSAMLKYCFSRNFFSNAFSCCVVNGVLGLRLGLCFLSVQRRGPGGGLNRRSEIKICVIKCFWNEKSLQNMKEMVHSNSVMYKIVCIWFCSILHLWFHSQEEFVEFFHGALSKFISSIDCVHITPDTRNV